MSWCGGRKSIADAFRCVPERSARQSSLSPVTPNTLHTQPAKGDDHLFDLLRSRELAEPTETLFSQGDMVAITEGPFAKLEAAYQMPDAEQRATVLEHILSQPVLVQIDAASLRKVS